MRILENIRVILNFIIAIVLIEIGFFLLLGDRIISKENSKDLSNYSIDEIPDIGTEVDVSLVDVGALFLETDDIFSVSYDLNCYYIAQMNNGRFIVLKAIKNSPLDRRISEYAEKCNAYYFLRNGKKPDTLYLEGRITTEPDYEDVDYYTSLDEGTKQMMVSRGYVRMDVDSIIFEAYENSARQSITRTLKSSLEIIVNMNKALKTVLGIVATLLGVFLIVNAIRDFLEEMSIMGEVEHEIIISNDVFSNIRSNRMSWNDELDELDYEHERREALKHKRENSSKSKTGGLRLKDID
ncbi:MAG: hypothetical protein IJV15_05360 [Lachnospiraceae bacterium]|nr:hypothetical protein [Lachnospiraceae bacterium]